MNWLQKNMHADFPRERSLTQAVLLRVMENAKYSDTTEMGKQAKFLHTLMSVHTPCENMDADETRWWKKANRRLEDFELGRGDFAFGIVASCSLELHVLMKNEEPDRTPGMVYVQITQHDVPLQQYACRSCPLHIVEPFTAAFAGETVGFHWIWGKVLEAPLCDVPTHELVSQDLPFVFGLVRDASPRLCVPLQLDPADNERMSFTVEVWQTRVEMIGVGKPNRVYSADPNAVRYVSAWYQDNAFQQYVPVEPISLAALLIFGLAPRFPNTVEVLVTANTRITAFKYHREAGIHSVIARLNALLWMSRVLGSPRSSITSLESHSETDQKLQ